MEIWKIIYLYVGILMIGYCDVEVSSDAAAAIKQQGDGQKQTFISSQSKAKTGKEASLEHSPEQEVGQRSLQVNNDHLTPLSWGYHDSANSFGPEKWSKYYPTCNGSRQSPIPLQAETNKLVDKLMKPLKMEGIDKDGVIYGDLVNDGHTFGIHVDLNKTNIKIKGGPLEEDTYKLTQFHFHFSCDNKDTGSEHSMDGLKYTAEAHFVFYNEKYPSDKEALDKPDGIVVLGYFIKSGASINYGTFLLNRYLIDISNSGSSIPVMYGISIFDLIKKLRDNIETLSYVTYQGSLTTPPCYETVTWLVFQEPIKVPLRDIESWRKLRGNHDEKLCGNFRPLQTINDRKMLYVNPSSSNKQK